MEFNTNLFLTTTIVVTSGVQLKVCMEIKKKKKFAAVLHVGILWIKQTIVGAPTGGKILFS